MSERRVTTLVLARHAQARHPESTLLGRDTPLSPLGRRQARALAAALAGGGLAAVYTSPLPRAVETAAVLCEQLGLAAARDARLVEFELGTNPIARIEKRPDLAIWRPDHCAVDGETLGAFSRRVAAFCDELAARHPGERVAVIAHAGTIDAALRWSLGMPPESPWQHEFDVPNASITELHFWPRGRAPGGAPRYTSLRRIGAVEHLGDLVTGL